MSAWTPLLPAALVGTDRHGTPLPTWPGAVGELIQQATSGAADPAMALLRAAAVLATCSAAGAQGAAYTRALPAPAAPDTQTALTDPAALTPLAWALREGPPRLVHTAALSLARAGLRWPAALLPTVLELGRRSLALRAVLAPTLGERGRWLAAQSADWQYAAGSQIEADETQRWQEGSFDQRRAWLLAARRQDPAAAREHLQQALPELPAKERAELAAVLVEGLGDGDETLLDTLRADRSREVRQAALSLLLRLPKAAHPQRAAARLSALVTSTRGLLGQRWQVDAPTAPGEDWKVDQLDNPRPQHDSLGERAWWLYQLVRQVPLPWWTAHTRMDAPALLAWAAKTDWAEALQRGWRDVLFAAPDDAWCDALLDHWPEALHDNPAAVLALLPPARRERHWQRQLQGTETRLDALLAQVLAACAPGETLSPALSAGLAQAVQARDRAGTLAVEHGVRAALPELAAALHIHTLADLARISRRPDDTPSWADTLHALAQVIATRRALQELTPESPP